MAKGDKAREALLENSTFGDETDIVFDGFETRPMTAAEKKAVERLHESTKAGGKALSIKEQQDLPRATAFGLHGDVTPAPVEGGPYK